MSDNHTIKDELVAKAKALAPAIAARAADVAAQRKPADESIQELIDAGIIQMFVPKRWGGAEAPLSTMMEVVEIISAVCPSTGWIAAFYISHNIYISKFPLKTQEELFGGKGYVLMPAATAPNMVATKVDGGWEVSGRASWGSGIMQADVVMMSGMTAEGPRGFIMPVEDVTVHDVWHFTGMAGTGSNDYQADKVFVPDHYSLPSVEMHAGRTEGSSHHDNPLFHIPFLMSAYCTILPVLTGTLRGGYDAYADITAKRVRNFTGAVVKEQPVAHVHLGEYSIATDAVGRLARDVYRWIEERMGGEDFSQADRLYAKGQTAFVSKTCRDTMNAMMAASGASSFHEAQPLQRYWRDLNTVSTHTFWDWDVTREMTGRMKLGLPVMHPLV
jgi:alkylation response protein AidB-like acyl-CoA dehydrogenase